MRTGGDEVKFGAEEVKATCEMMQILSLMKRNTHTNL